MINILKQHFFLVTLIIFSITIFVNYTVSAQGNTNTVKKIVLDAGHGGKDPGALGKRTKEKNLTLAITLKLGKYIKEGIPGVEVIYTRTTDKFLELDKRTEIANKEKADVFISIHINSCANKKIKGACTYVTGLAKSQENLNIAMLENSVIKNEENYETKYSDIPQQPDDYILSSLYQNTHLNQSIILAGLIQKQFKTRANRIDRGVNQANFVVLWRATMPCVLIECGFISNADEEKELASDYWQNIIASAIFRAFREYKEALESGTLDMVNSENQSKTTTEQKPSENKTPQQNTNTTPKSNQNNKTDNSKICFKVQLKSSKSRINTNSSIFKGIDNVEEILIDGYYKYTIGCEQDINKIIKLQNEVRTKIPDAFVIAVKGNQRINIDVAKKELGIK